MKDRILTNWTFRRALYLIIGLIIIGNSILEKQYIGLLLGGYFASMAIFSFGCAARNCTIPLSRTSESKTKNTIFEEVK